ncbi:MAG: PHB depolymerase family esterase [Agriterribacter sp.]
MRNRHLFIQAGLMITVLIISGCSKNTPPDTENIYRFSGSIKTDGIDRAYTLNLPPGYYESSGFSLVIAMHGGGGSSSQFENTSKLTEKADAAGFIVVYPEGTGAINTWNAGACCGSAVTNKIDDVTFISRLIDHLLANYKINPKKVYATGHSNGGMMSYRLACELSDKIAAIAPNSCTMVVNDDCTPSRPVPVLHMHSKLDENVVYTGGYGKGISGVYCPPLDSVLNVWSVNNGCTAPAQVMISNSRYTFKKWDQCSNNSSVHYYLTEDGGHAWPGGLPSTPNADIPSSSINANDLLWEFFQQYQLP